MAETKLTVCKKSKIVGKVARARKVGCLSSWQALRARLGSITHADDVHPARLQGRPAQPCATSWFLGGIVPSVLLRHFFHDLALSALEEVDIIAILWNESYSTSIPNLMLPRLFTKCLARTRLHRQEALLNGRLTWSCFRARGCRPAQVSLYRSGVYKTSRKLYARTLKSHILSMFFFSFVTQKKKKKEGGGLAVDCALAFLSTYGARVKYNPNN